jgi:hypothetical protein
MESQVASQAGSRPWVEWFAGRIDDPVMRLRFLQSLAPPEAPSRPRRRRMFRAVLTVSLLSITLASAFLVRAGAGMKSSPTPPVRPPSLTPRIQSAPEVWQVEQNGDSEVYSNGLRLDNRFRTSTHPRSYLAFPAAKPASMSWLQRSDPAGIVFHTTESHQAPFEASENGVLKKIGESLAEYVRRKCAYNFLIDRFGRVYRIVPETDAANHAGFSVWSDEKWLYVNLNESFLGVSFEAKTEPGQTEPSVSSAQIRAAAMLTEMLRSRYGIPARNCVTHAQVSVNPSNMRVGYHTDWASSFPFDQLGLPDNYLQVLPAIAVFGFEYDAHFVQWTGTRVHAGVELAEEQLQRDAGVQGMSPALYRKLLQKRYRQRLAEQRIGAASGDESW